MPVYLPWIMGAKKGLSATHMPDLPCFRFLVRPRVWLRAFPLMLALIAIITFIFLAREFRSRGAEAAEKIRAEADRQRDVLVAEAQRDAEIRRGQGDAAASDIYAQAYGKNKEFFQFNRSLIAYRQAFRDDRSMMVVSPDSEFFQYFKNPK